MRGGGGGQGGFGFNKRKRVTMFWDKEVVAACVQTDVREKVSLAVTGFNAKHPCNRIT